MMQPALRIVILGCGFGGLCAAKAFAGARARGSMKELEKA
jgi:NADH dehydrogenase FAD-containing subunit